jgi:DNA-binding PadR family transcriptional regulator
MPGMASRSRSNPLALAVLTCLYERPMHPYEIGQTLRSRHKHESIRLNYGSLYGVVESLDRRRLIHAVETTREGRRPQRTVYEITERGTIEMNEWLSELVAVPTKEYLQFEAALSLIGALPPDEVLPLLDQRCLALEMRIEQSRAMNEAAAKRGLPAIFFIEDDYVRRLLEAELDFTRQLATDIRGGAIDGVADWEAWHAGGGAWATPPASGLVDPAETAETAETATHTNTDSPIDPPSAAEDDAGEAG